MIGGSDFRLAVLGRADAHLHVRLTRANPNLADQNILESDRIAGVALNGHFQWLVDRSGIKLAEGDLPSAVVAGFARDGLPRDGNGDGLAFFGPAPDRQSSPLVARPCCSQSRPAI